MNSAYSFKSISVFPHHVKKTICGSRARYRDGRKDTAVKVYTVNQESVYLLLTNVPAVGGGEDLRALCDQYGIVDDFKPLDDYPTEDFTEAYLVKYGAFPSARAAKKRLDDKSFLGSTLHVCYAPEFETVLETSLKLQERRKFIAWKTNSGQKNQASSSSGSTQSLHTNLVAQRSSSALSTNAPVNQQPVTYVWAGKEYTVQPSPLPEPSHTIPEKPRISGMFVPRQCKSNVNSSKLVTSLNSGNTYQQHLINSAPQKSTVTEDPSYQHTISQVRAKVSSVSVPNVRISLKRKKRL